MRANLARRAAVDPSRLESSKRHDAFTSVTSSGITSTSGEGSGPASGFWLPITTLIASQPEQCRAVQKARSPRFAVLPDAAQAGAMVGSASSSGMSSTGATSRSAMRARRSVSATVGPWRRLRDVERGAVSAAIGNMPQIVRHRPQQDFGLLLLRCLHELEKGAQGCGTDALSPSFALRLVDSEVRCSGCEQLSASAADTGPMKFGHLLLRLFDGGGFRPSYAVWTWQDSELVVAIFEAGEA